MPLSAGLLKTLLALEELHDFAREFTATGGEQAMCEEFFGQLKQRFPVKNLGHSRCTLIARSSVTGTAESSR